MNKILPESFLFLSSMMGWTDARFCVERGQGAQMVQLGALLAAKEEQFQKQREKNPEYFLPADEKESRKLLESEVETVREGLGGNISVALNLGVFDLTTGLEAARSWKRAGGDFLELNVHGNWNRTPRKGFLRGMARPSYRKRLVKWSQELAEAGPPLILKFSHETEVDFPALLKEMGTLNITGFHFNIKTGGGRPNFCLAQQMVNRAPGKCLFSGEIREPSQVRKLFELGAEGVGFARPVLKEQGFLEKMENDMKSNAKN